MSRKNGRITSMEFQVRRSEINPTGTVHHSTYITWLEEARLRQIQAHDLEPELDYALKITDLTAQFHHPVSQDLAVVVRCWIHALKQYSITFFYEIVQGDVMLMAASSDHVYTDPSGLEIQIPLEWTRRAEVPTHAAQ